MGTDKVTKLLLGSIAVGIWALVLLNGVTTSRLAELNAEVKAIGLDTEQIHEDLDPGGEDGNPSSGQTLHRGWPLWATPTQSPEAGPCHIEESPDPS